MNNRLLWYYSLGLFSSLYYANSLWLNINGGLAFSAYLCWGVNHLCFINQELLEAERKTAWFSRQETVGEFQNKTCFSLMIISEVLITASLLSTMLYLLAHLFR